MKVKLQTRCGCSKVIDIRSPVPQIQVPLLRSFPSVNSMTEGELLFSEPHQIRVFERMRGMSDSEFEYIYVERE